MQMLETTTEFSKTLLEIVPAVQHLKILLPSPYHFKQQQQRQ
jgi:hypothetical protein